MKEYSHSDYLSIAAVFGRNGMFQAAMCQTVIFTITVGLLMTDPIAFGLLITCLQFLLVSMSGRNTMSDLVAASPLT